MNKSTRGLLLSAGILAVVLVIAVAVLSLRFRSANLEEKFTPEQKAVLTAIHNYG